MEIVRAAADDLESILMLLRQSGLPTDGVADHLGLMLVARDGQTIIGCAGLEMYERYALLRSVAVEERCRGTGLGHTLTQAALTLAQTEGVVDVFLLTTTADRFFPRFGFRRIERSEVPPVVQASVEFTSACPASAVVMRTHLTHRRVLDDGKQ